jgi:hypothetical protein
MTGFWVLFDFLVLPPAVSAAVAVLLTKYGMWAWLSIFFAIACGMSISATLALHYAPLKE